MKRKLSVFTIVALILAGFSPSAAHATTINGSFPCTTNGGNTGSFTVANNVVTGHTNCAGHANIPAGVTSIGDSAFRNASSLTSLTIPNSVTSIRNSAFRNASSLTSLTIPNSVTSIGDIAFAGASSLISLTIPNSVTSIGDSAFDGASSLTSLTIPNSVTSIEDFSFFGASSLTSLTIPNSVTSIGNFAFRDASSLISLTIPNSVTSIGSSAFLGATSLNTVTLLGSPPATVGSNAFLDLPSGARALVSRSHIGTGAGKYGNVGSTWNRLIVTVPTSTLALNSGQEVTNQTVEFGVAPTSPQLSRAGFSLAGWSATQGGTAAFQADLSDFTMGPTAGTLFAVWEASPASTASDEVEQFALQFSGPLLTGVDRRVFDSNSPSTMTLVGKRMNQVVSATIDGAPVVIESSSRSELTIAIEARKPGTYTLVLHSRFGRLSLLRFLVVK